MVARLAVGAEFRLGRLRRLSVEAERPDLQKRVSASVRARRVVAHPDVGLSYEFRAALRGIPFHTVSGMQMESSDTSDSDVLASVLANVRHGRALAALAVQGADSSCRASMWQLAVATASVVDAAQRRTFAILRRDASYLEKDPAAFARRPARCLLRWRAAVECRAAGLSNRRIASLKFARDEHCLRNRRHLSLWLAGLARCWHAAEWCAARRLRAGIPTTTAVGWTSSRAQGGFVAFCCHEAVATSRALLF